MLSETSIPISLQKNAISVKVPEKVWVETVAEPTVEVDLDSLTMDGLVLFPPVGHKVTLEFIALCLLDIFSTCEPSTCFKTKNNKT